MIDDTKLVDFHDYCERCKNFDEDPWDDPCDECLNTPARPNSHKPINFKEKE